MTNMAGEEDIEVDCLVLWVIVIWTQSGLVGVEVREGREKKSLFLLLLLHLHT